jgi:hypothetical protein
VKVRIGMIFAAVTVTLSPLTVASAYAAPTTGDHVEQSRTDELVELVSANPTTFAGIVFDEASRVATIRYPTASGLRPARERLAGLTTQGATRGVGAERAWRLAWAPVAHSQAELVALKDRLTWNTSERRTIDPWLSEWYVDVAPNVVAVGVTEVTPAVREAASRTFGGLVELHVAPRPDRYSNRYDDVEPWSAGTNLIAPWHLCSSGFIIRKRSDRREKRMVTAGHCVAQGDQVTNNGRLVGTVMFRSRSENGLDVAFVNGSTYRPWMYTGPARSSFAQGADVRGTRLPAEGLIFCTNGARTGENCAAKVEHENLCVKFTDGVTTCSLTMMRSVDGTVISQQGDSGGPVITYEAGRLKICGMMIGGAGNGTEVLYHPFFNLIPVGWQVDFVP